MSFILEVKLKVLLSMSGTQEGSKYSKTKSVASTAPEGQYLWDNHGERIAELD